jgi:hypothetical protein
VPPIAAPLPKPAAVPFEQKMRDHAPEDRLLRLAPPALALGAVPVAGKGAYRWQPPAGRQPATRSRAVRARRRTAVRRRAALAIGRASGCRTASPFAETLADPMRRSSDGGVAAGPIGVACSIWRRRYKVQAEAGPPLIAGADLALLCAAAAEGVYKLGVRSRPRPSGR